MHFIQENVLELSIEGLEASIEKCKTLILQCEESSTRRRALVHKLIKIRLRLQVRLPQDFLCMCACMITYLLEFVLIICFGDSFPDAQKVIV